MITAFYPCCERDIEQPLMLLANHVDKVIFCDNREKLAKEWKKIYSHLDQERLPKAEFIIGNAKEVIDNIGTIDILFYRRDSACDGGSGLFVLGDFFLRPFVQHFPPNGGMLITDGSNSRGANFKKMIRQNGLIKHGYKFSALHSQPYLTEHGLWCISANAIESN